MSMERIISRTGTGVMVHNLKGEIISANEQAVRMLGLPRHEIIGRTPCHPRWYTVREDWSPLTEREHPVIVALKEKKSVRGSIIGVFHSKTQTHRWIVLNADPVFAGKSGKLKQVIATIHEVEHPGTEWTAEDAILEEAASVI